jgi:arginase
VESPHCLGVEITVFDPDYDPDGSYAHEITATIVAGLAAVRTVPARPDLIAARRDLDEQRSGTARAGGSAGDAGNGGRGPARGRGARFHAADAAARVRHRA